MPFPWLAAALIATVVSTGASVAATQEQVKAEKKRAKTQRRTQELARVKENRRAIAQRRVQEAEIIQGGEASGTRTNSAVSGAVGSLRSTTAGNIGFANTQFAGNTLASRQSERGMRNAARLGTFANVAGTAASLFATGASLRATSQQAAQTQYTQRQYGLPGDPNIPWSIRRVPGG